jgi:DNA-binding NarL/FixJ family response regulator
MIRVLITDDYRLWRLGVRAFLERDDDIAVVGEARDGQEAIDLAKQLSPDVVLMDIQMPHVDGLQAAEEIQAHQPNTRVVVLSGNWEEPQVRQAVQRGARGFLPKDIEPQVLVSAVHAVYENKTFFDSRLERWIASDTPAA